ncbi:CLUMA_CG016876, isoform A [Clunio marinus]|uniref:CLUMA_CG016876, isoform A n=1 Tax=Clunio marinus TaxID=568069 RepID=A0A1J1ISZ2_9DIPT|nr:CLUMA_CG016876, isoform A [Clunio marinus]
MKSVSSETTQKTCSKNTIDPSRPRSLSHVSSNSAPLLLNSIGFQIPSFPSSLFTLSASIPGSASSSLSAIGGSALFIGLFCGIS